MQFFPTNSEGNSFCVEARRSIGRDMYGLLPQCFVSNWGNEHALVSAWTHACQVPAQKRLAMLGLSAGKQWLLWADGSWEWRVVTGLACPFQLTSWQQTVRVQIHLPEVLIDHASSSLTLLGEAKSDLCVILASWSSRTVGLSGRVDSQSAC